MTVKLGVLEHWFDGEPVVPGRTLADRLAALEEAGYQGIQLSAVSHREGMDAMIEGFKSMLLAVLVLILAWGIGRITGELHTADFVVGITTGVLSPHWLPVLVFLAAAALSFATGTSWGTMAILMPLVIPWGYVWRHYVKRPGARWRNDP